MKTSPFKVMTTAALATAVAIPAATMTAQADEASIENIAFTLDGEVTVVSYDDYVDAIISESGELYEYTEAASVAAVGVGDGVYVDYDMLVNAVLDADEDTTAKEVLAEQAENEDAVVDEDTVAEYDVWGEEEVVAPVVESVTSDNLKQVEFELNTLDNIDSDVLEDAANYSVETDADSKVNASDVSVDGNTVTVTLDAAVSNQTSGELTINKSVLGTEDNFVSDEITFYDATVPTTDDIQLVGPNKFEIHFSEPIETKGTVEVDNGIYGVSDISLSGNVATVELAASSLSEGEYDVSVQGFEDYAGYTALAKSFTLDYEKDETAPEPSIKSASQTKVVVEFDKPVEFDGEDFSELTNEEQEAFFYHTYTSYTPDSVETSDDKTFTLEFTDNPLPEGEVNVHVLREANDIDLTDEWGNQLEENKAFTVDIEADDTNPEVTAVTPDESNQNQVHVSFSEDVLTSDAEDEDNFTVTNADGEEVTEFNANYTANEADGEYYTTLTFENDLNGNYNVEVSDVSDNSLAQNELNDVTVSFNVTDVNNPDLSTTTVKSVDNTGDDSNDYLYVYFPEKMSTEGDYSVLDKSNYQIGDNDLDSDDTIELFGDSSKVKITLDDADQYNDLKDKKLTIARLKDATGNPSQELFVEQNISEVELPELKEAVVTDHKTVRLKFDQPLKDVTTESVFVKNDTDSTYSKFAYVSSEVKSEDGELFTYVNGTLKDDEQFSEDDTSVAADSLDFELQADDLVTETGRSYDSDKGVSLTIEDGYAPELASTSRDVNNDVELTFTESLSVGGSSEQALASTNFTVTDENGDVLEYVYGNPSSEEEFSVDYSSANSSTITIDVYGDVKSEEVDVEYNSNKYITDGEGNLLKEFDITVDPSN